MGKNELQVSTESLTVVPDGEGSEVLRMAADGKVGQNCVGVSFLTQLQEARQAWIEVFNHQIVNASSWRK